MPDPIALVTAGLVVAIAARWHRPRRRPARQTRREEVDRRRAAPRPRPPPEGRPRVVAGVAAVAAAVGTLSAAGSLAVPIAAVVAGAIVRRALRRRAHSRRAAAATAALVPDVVELVLVGIHAGLTPARAVLGLRPYIAPSLAPVVDEIERRVGTGETLADALAAFTEIGGRAFQPFVSALALAERTGDPLGPVLDRLADDARRDRRRLADASARELPVRLTVPLVCCTLPAFLLLTIAPVLAGALSSLRGAAP